MASWTTEQLSSFLLFTDNQDMEAINRFMSDTVAVTPEAVRLKDDWIRWWDTLGWGEKNVGTQAFDEARNRRNAFIIANAITPSQKKDMEDVVKHGITSEEMQGDTRRADSSGKFPEPPPPPLVPDWMKLGTGIAALAGIALGIASIVSKLNPVSLLAGAVKRK